MAPPERKESIRCFRLLHDLLGWGSFIRSHSRHTRSSPPRSVCFESNFRGLDALPTKHASEALVTLISRPTASSGDTTAVYLEWRLPDATESSLR